MLLSPWEKVGVFLAYGEPGWAEYDEMEASLGYGKVLMAP